MNATTSLLPGLSIILTDRSVDAYGRTTTGIIRVLETGYEVAFSWQSIRFTVAHLTIGDSLTPPEVYVALRAFAQRVESAASCLPTSTSVSDELSAHQVAQ